MKTPKAIKRLTRMVTSSRKKCREDPVTARNQGSPSNRNRNFNQRKVSANTASDSKVHRADSKESEIYRRKRDQKRIELNQNGGTRRKRNHSERNNGRSDSIDTKKKSIHRSLLSRICSKRKTKKAILRKATRQRDDEKQDKEARGKHKDFVSSQVELTQKLFQQKKEKEVDDLRHDQMETDILQSSISSFDADWSYKIDSTAATNRGKNSALNSDIDNTNTHRSQSKGSQPAYTSNKSPRGNTYRRKPDQDEPKDRRQPSKNKSTAKKSRGSRKNELDSTLRELFHLIGKKNKDSPKVKDPSMNSRNGSSRNQRERRHGNEKQTHSRSLKRNDRAAIRSKSKNPRSKSLPPSQQPKRGKSPRRALPTEKSPDKRTKTAPTKQHTDPSLPLKNYSQQRASKNQPIEEPSETSQTDRTARTEYTSSSGPVDQSSRNQRARSRSKSRRSASRTRSSSRRPQKNRARSTSRKPRSTNSHMSVEDAKKVLYPTNHPTYVIQPVIDSSSEDEDDERERRTGSQPSPRRRRSQKRDASKDRGFSGLGVQQSKPRKGRRPKRPSEESKTEKRESPPSSPVITLSTRSSRRIQRSHSRERQRKEKHLSPEVIKIEGTKYLSDAMNKYPNPFVKTT